MLGSRNIILNSLSHRTCGALKMLDDTVSLHTSTPTPERRRSPVLVLIWVSVIVSHLAFGGIILLTISHSRESGYQNRALEDLTRTSTDLREEMRLWQAYVISLQKKLLENGIQVPEAPIPKQKEE